MFPASNIVTDRRNDEFWQFNLPGSNRQISHHMRTDRNRITYRWVIEVGCRRKETDAGLGSHCLRLGDRSLRLGDRSLRLITEDKFSQISKGKAYSAVPWLHSDHAVRFPARTHSEQRGQIAGTSWLILWRATVGGPIDRPECSFRQGFSFEKK